MPEIGERRRASEIFGGNNRHYYVWVACPKCGKQRWVAPHNQRYTSPDLEPCLKCKTGRPRKGEIKSCPICGKTFYVKPSNKKEVNYCSPQCYNVGQTKGQDLTCKVCGKPYHRPPSEIKWRGSSCCSIPCANIYQRTNQKGEKSHSWQGGKSSIYHCLRSSAAFKDWREAVFKRDNYTCQDCGARNGNGKAVYLHPHHIKSFTHHPELRFDVGNGITLCKTCHNRHTAWQKLNHFEGKWHENKNQD